MMLDYVLYSNESYLAKAHKKRGGVLKFYGAKMSTFTLTEQSNNQYKILLQT